MFIVSMYPGDRKAERNRIWQIGLIRVCRLMRSRMIGISVLHQTYSFVVFDQYITI